MSQKIDALFAQLEQEAGERQLPPVHLWHPEREGEIDIVIRADGTWVHEGRAFERMAIVRLFSTILRREGDAYFLVTPAEKLAITVEDAPLLAVDFEVRGQGAEQELLFSTNCGDHVVADAEHRIWLENDRPYVHVRDGLNALIGRSAFYRLADLAETDDQGSYVVSRGENFRL